MSDQPRTPGPRRRVSRTRGATSGFLLVLLGLWGALIPFIGPYFDFSFTPDKSWHWSPARGWLEVLPGGVAVLGGLLLLVSASRATTMLGAWLGVAGGAWFAIGLPLAEPLHLGSPGQPAGTGRWLPAGETLAMFTALGVVILFVAAVAFGRLSVVTLRDVHAAEQREQAAAAEAAAAEEAAAHEEAVRAAAAHQAAVEEAGRHQHAPDQDRDETAPAEPSAGYEPGHHAAPPPAPPAGSPTPDPSAPPQSPANEGVQTYDPNRS